MKWCYEQTNELTDNAISRVASRSSNIKCPKYCFAATLNKSFCSPPPSKIQRIINKQVFFKPFCFVISKYQALVYFSFSSPFGLWLDIIEFLALRLSLRLKVISDCCTTTYVSLNLLFHHILSFKNVFNISCQTSKTVAF